VLIGTHQKMKPLTPPKKFAECSTQKNIFLVIPRHCIITTHSLEPRVWHAVAKFMYEKIIYDASVGKTGEKCVYMNIFQNALQVFIPPSGAFFKNFRLHI
jgi:hypothetical protein